MRWYFRNVNICKEGNIKGTDGICWWSLLQGRDLLVGKIVWVRLSALSTLSYYSSISSVHYVFDVQWENFNWGVKSRPELISSRNRRNSIRACDRNRCRSLNRYLRLWTMNVATSNQQQDHTHGIGPCWVKVKLSTSIFGKNRAIL